MATADDYLDLPYHIILVRDQDDAGNHAYVAEIQELPGCISQGDTPTEAVQSLRDAMAGWITVALEDGKAIPSPRAEHNAQEATRWPTPITFSEDEVADEADAGLEFEFDPDRVPRPRWSTCDIYNVQLTPEAVADIERIISTGAARPTRPPRMIPYATQEQWRAYLHLVSHPSPDEGPELTIDPDDLPLP